MTDERTTDEGRPTNLHRRELLAAVTTAAATGTAGCAVRFEDGGVQFDFGDGGEAATPTFGYGGTSTATPTESGGSTSRGTDTPGNTDTPAPTATSTSTDTPSVTPAPADDYGDQRYGQYGYGG